MDSCRIRSAATGLKGVRCGSPAPTDRAADRRRRGVLAQVENRGYAPRNAQERHDMLQGSRLGDLIFMMKGRHGVRLP